MDIVIWRRLRELHLRKSENEGFQPWRDYMQLALAVQEMQRGNLASGPQPIREFKEPPPRESVTPHWHEKEPRGGAKIVNVRKDAFCPARETKPAPRPAPRPGTRPRPVTRNNDGRWFRKFCCFCHQNGEAEMVFSTHWLKDKAGNVVCPYLWQYVCPFCGATGSQAHTKRFCPQVDESYCSVFATAPRRQLRK